MRITQINERVGSMLTAIMLLAFMTGFVPFFQTMLDNGGASWKSIYYGFWLVSLISAIVSAFTAPRYLQVRIAWLVGVVVVMLALCGMHHVDGVTKNFIAIALLLLVFIALASTTAPASLARLGAWIVLLNAFICFLDALYPIGFSNTLGRSAGLFVNPNVAGLSLMLGASATVQAVPKRWKLCFCIVVGTAIVLTLSRSTAILTLGAVAVTLAARIVFSPTGATLRRILLRPHRKELVLLTACVAWIAFAAIMNSRIAVAADSSFGTIGTVMHFFRDIASHLHLGKTADGGVSIANLKELGDENSIAARRELMLRSANAFLNGPWNGVGLTVAHDLAPHDSFLLFAVAFGYPGLLLSIVLLSACVAACGVRNLALPTALVGAMLVSHDLLMPSLVAPIVVGTAYFLAKRERTERYSSQSAARFAMPTFAAAAGFSIAALTVVHLAGAQVSQTLTAEDVRPNAGNASLALVPRSPFSGLLLSATRDVDGFNFLDDGRALTAGPKRDVVGTGDGKYSIDDGYVINFAPFGNVPPAATHLSIETKALPHPLFLPLFALVLLWCGALLARENATRNAAEELELSHV